MSIRKGQVIVAGAGNARRNIGEVYYSQSSLATDNSGALPLFTGESIASANTIYPEFYAWVERHTELQTTAEEYETALSTYGECPKYVISNGALRLPKHKISERYLVSSKSATSSDPNWYNLYSDGWLEQGGKLTFPDASVTDVVFPKPFADTNYIWTQGQMTKNFANAQFYNGWGLESYSETGFRVTNSTNGTNEIAWAACGQGSLASGGKIEYPWVTAYVSSIEASTAQVAEFQQGLIGKADVNLENVTEEGKENAVSWGRNFVTVGKTIASGTAGINGTYELGFTDGKVRIGVFYLALATSNDGFSSMAIMTDVVTANCVGAACNNGHANAGTITLPFINSVTLSFPSTGAGVKSGTMLSFIGYFE